VNSRTVSVIKSTYRKICDVGVRVENDEIVNRQIVQLNAALLWGLVVCITSYFVYWALDVTILLRLLEVAIVGQFLGFFCNSRGFYRSARLISNIPALTSIGLMALWMGKNSHIEVHFLGISVAAFFRYDQKNLGERNFLLFLVALAWATVDFLQFFNIDIFESHCPENYIPYIRLVTDGTIFLFMTVLPLKMVSISHHAEGELKKTIEVVKAQQAQLAQSTKMGALGEMASGVGHEINNPLTILIGSAERLERELSREDWRSLDSSMLRKQVERIVHHSKRISKIVHGLRAFARDGTKDPFVPVEAQRIVRETLYLCQSKLASQEIDLRVTLPAHPVWVSAREVQISQILLNLITNAADAIATLPERWVAVKLACENGKVIFEVEDSGHGIPPDVVERLMQPFFTTKEVGKGTGLGLSISKGLAEEHGGRLIYNVNRARTTFQLELPEVFVREEMKAG
jgi:signal transduction histidine kinase